MDHSTTPYRHAASPRMRVTLNCTDRHRTKQEFKDECDINKLLERYQQQGVPPRVNSGQPQWGDFTAPDLQTALNTVIEAEALFDELPSSLRNRFDNDPVKLLDWVHDPKNAQEAVSLGFLDAQRLPAGWGSLPPPQNAPSASQAPSQASQSSQSGASGGKEPPKGT